MMSFPKVSVITVNWNNFSDSSECLESLRKATYPNFEVIVVDNGSLGNDVSLLKERFGDSAKLILNERNSGFAGGCNLGIKDALARGADYVVLLNNDTVVAPDFLEALVNVAQSDKTVGIAGGKVLCYEIPELIWFAGGIINYNTGRTPIIGSGEADRGQFNEITSTDWISGCFMFISREALQATGLLDDRFFFGWEDVDICVRATRKGFKVLYVPESRIWHKGFGINKRDRLMGMPVYYATRGQFLFIDKHFTKQQLAIAWLYFVATFPKFVWDYSRILHQWKVPLYIFWGIGGYLRIKFREYAKTYSTA